MRASAEELLYILLWTAEALDRPTWRNATTTFEEWAHFHGLTRRLAELERRQLVESAPGDATIVRLTEAGRRAALGGRDPEERWARSWDGKWRLILFDIPAEKHGLRTKLLRHLRAAGFGYLQNSVWISPDRFDRSQLPSLSSEPDTEAGLVIEGEPCAGESSMAIVNGAWSFADINAGYAGHARLLATAPLRENRLRLRRWLLAERAKWSAVIRCDPLLPAALLPKGYGGRTVWQQRREMLSRAALVIGMQ